MKIKDLKYIALVISFFFNQVIAQDLDLFQAVDLPDEGENNSRRAQRNERINSAPAFTLVGTSRFGDNYIASLKSRDGNSVIVEWEKGLVKEIQGFIGYGLVNIESRKVVIRLPEDDPCIPATDKGVQCNGDLAILTLSNAQPTEPTMVTEESVVETTNNNVSGSDGNNQTDNDQNETVTFTNPFTGEEEERPALTPEEEAEREARRQRRAEQFRNFEIVRIPDNEIPEGMQRIRTPFGDRLEPVEE